MTKAVPLQFQVVSLHFAKVDIEISLDGSWVVKPPAAGDGRGRAELQKTGVGEGYPLIASGSKSLGFVGGLSSQGYVPGVPRAAAGRLFCFLLPVCCVEDVRIYCMLLLRGFRSPTGSLICRSPSSARGGLQALFPFLTFTGSILTCRKGKASPRGVWEMFLL